jgi:hypothetical protein
MFRPIVRVPCACCHMTVNREPKQKKTHYFIGCGCPVTPLVCSHCRWGSFRRRPTVCMWCQKRGYCTSFNFASHAKDLNSAARDWISVQKSFSNVSIPYIMQIRLNWLKYLEFRKIKFYKSLVIILFFVEDLSKKNSITFFQSFMQAQMFHITGAQKISIQYDKFMINQKLFWLVKNITVARMLICNLFGKSKNTRFFTGRRKIVKSNKELMSIVLHRCYQILLLLIL